MKEEQPHHHTSNYDRFMSGEYCNSLNQEVLEMISNTKACLARLDSPDLEDSERSGILRNMLGSIGLRSSSLVVISYASAESIFSLGISLSSMTTAQ